MDKLQSSGNSLKEREKRQKQVIKPMLDNPFTSVNWPFIDQALAADILQHLRVLSQPLRQFIHQEPLVRDQIVLGFNEVTKQLEKQASAQHQATMKYVFVCKYDLSPPILYQHFPVLTFTAAKGSSTSIKLVQLPKGSSQELADILQVKDASVFALNGEIPQATELYKLLDTVTDVQVPFLSNHHFNQLRVHYLSTSAPLVNRKSDSKIKKATQPKKNRKPNDTTK